MSRTADRQELLEACAQPIAITDLLDQLIGESPTRQTRLAETAYWQGLIQDQVLLGYLVSENGSISLAPPITHDESAASTTTTKTTRIVLVLEQHGSQVSLKKGKRNAITTRAKSVRDLLVAISQLEGQRTIDLSSITKNRDTQRKQVERLRKFLAHFKANNLVTYTDGQLLVNHRLYIKEKENRVLQRASNSPLGNMAAAFQQGIIDRNRAHDLLDDILDEMLRG